MSHAVSIDARTEAAYAFCRAIARREAKNFYWAFRVLPRHKSDAMCAVYAFMRRADDISDDESKPIEARREEMKSWLAAWRASRTAAANQFSPNTNEDPVFLALSHTQRRFNVPDSLLEELVAGTTMDLEPLTSNLGPVQTYATFDDLYSYCYLVASVVGLVCIRIFGYTDARAEILAEDLHLLRYDAGEQAVIDGDQDPQCGAAVGIDQRSELACREIVFLCADGQRRQHGALAPGHRAAGGE